MGKLTKVIGGGQTGGDQSGWHAAVRCGIATGGTMPLRFRTEDGHHPEFAEMYGAVEDKSYDWRPRTKKNAAEADLTLWVGKTGSPGYWLTRNSCKEAGRPFREIIEPFPAEHMMFIVVDRVIQPPDHDYTINIAGNRESKLPGIGERAEAFLVELFKELTKEV